MKRSFRVKWLTWLGIAVAHFGLSNLILPLTAALTAQAAQTPDGAGMAVTLLVRATKLLHFPLITLALYPREWFPGSWVYVPMALNSAMWAFGICGLIVLYRRSG
jgi:hypothetical protein